MKKLWPWGFVVLSLTVLAGLLVVPRSPEAQEFHGGEVALVDAGPEGLVLSAWVRSTSLEPGDTVRVFVQAENRSDRAIEGLDFIGLTTPELERRGDCWRRSTPICRANAAPEGSTAKLGLPNTLEPGQAETVYGDLTANDEGVFQLLAELRWRTSIGGVARRQILIGPLRVVDPTWGLLRTWAERLSSIASDLAFPIVLALFGWFLKRRDDQEAERREDAKIAADRAEEERSAAAERLEKERKEFAAKEEAARKQEKERLENARREAAANLEAIKAQVHQTWNQLLGKHLQDCQNHYLLALFPLRNLAEGSRSGATERSTFFYLMLSVAAMRKLSIEIGGVHFRNRRAERAFGRLWASWLNAAKRILGEVLLPLGVRRIDPLDDFATFSGRLAERDSRVARVPSEVGDLIFGEDKEVLGELERRFIKWSVEDPKGFECARTHLEALVAILDFEINRPFQYWYEELPGVEDLPKLIGDLTRLPAEMLEASWPRNEKDLEKIEVYRQDLLRMEQEPRGL